MVKARKRSELNPDPYTYSVNNYWSSVLPDQRLAGDIIKPKNNASTNTNFSFSSRVLANNFFLQVLWKRTNRNDSGTSSVVIYLFFNLFLFWHDWTRVLAKSQSSMKHTFMQIFLWGHFTLILSIFMSWLWRHSNIPT